MQSQVNYTGIDISKTFFDVAIEQQGRYLYYKLSNDESGFKSLLEVLTPGTQVIMEASGPYYLRLASYLYEEGIGVSIINPLVIRRFCQMRMSRAKTDKKDARMIAEYGKTERPALWQRPQKHVIALQHLEALLSNLIKEQTALSNQLESFKAGGMLDSSLGKIINKELKHKEALIKMLTRRMEDLAEQHYAEMLANLESIPGIGKKNGDDADRAQ